MSVSGEGEPEARRQFRFRASRHPDGDSFRYDRVSGRLFRDGEAVPLQPRASAVLGYLLAEQGRLVSRDELIDQVWEGVSVADSSVTEAIALVRAALGDDRREPRFIQTVPKRGYRFIAPVRVGEAPAGRGTARERRPVGVGIAVATLVAVAVAALSAGWWLGSRMSGGGGESSAPMSVHLALSPPPQLSAGAGSVLAISPRGTLLAYVADAGAEASRLQIVDLRRGSSWALERTTGRPRAPFFNSRGDSLAYFHRDRIMRVALTVGRTAVPEEVGRVDRAPGVGGAWHGDGRIVYAPGVGHGLWLVDVETGARRRLTEREAGERAHLMPTFLPDGSILFCVLPDSSRRSASPRLEVVDPRTGGRRAVAGPGGKTPSFVPPDRLLFVRADTLFAAPFDPGTLQVGEARPVHTALRTGARIGANGAHVTVSDEGTLALLPAARVSSGTILRWVDIGGRTEPIERSRERPLGAYRISPDGGRLVGEAGGDLWTLDLVDGTHEQLTASPRTETRPVWGPGPGQVTFAAERGGGFELHTMDVEEPGGESLLRGAAVEGLPEHWSPDGELLLFRRMDPRTGADLWLLDASGRARPLVNGDAAERDGRFSPDGRWVAFVSDETGRNEIWVRPVTPTAEALRVTRGGGALPRWSADGLELFLRRGTALYRTPLRLDRSVEAGPEERLFDEPRSGFFYDLAPDGRRLLVRRAEDAARFGQALVVRGWRRWHRDDAMSS